MFKEVLFDFLDNMPVKEIEKSMATTTVGIRPVPGADFRLFSDGRLFPSEERIVKDALDFQYKDAAVEENGYDIFLSHDWGQFDKTKPNFVCIAKVSKKLPKVDLFATTRYNTDGSPKSNIKNYETTVPDLIQMLEKVYLDNQVPGQTLFQNATYVDLKIEFKHPVKQTSNGIYNIPKKISRGKSAGQLSYERREVITIYPLSLVRPEAKQHVQTSAIDLGHKAAAQVSNSANAVPEDLAAKIFG